MSENSKSARDYQVYCNLLQMPTRTLPYRFSRRYPSIVNEKFGYNWHFVPDYNLLARFFFAETRNHEYYSHANARCIPAAKYIDRKYYNEFLDILDTAENCNKNALCLYIINFGRKKKTSTGRYCVRFYWIFTTAPARRRVVGTNIRQMFTRRV